MTEGTAMYPSNWRKPTDHQPTQPRHRTAKPGRFNTPARRDWTLNRLIEQFNTGRTTVAQYLASIGATQAFIDQFGAAFGTKASKAFQAHYGHKPEQNGLALRKGRLYRAFAYTAEQLPVLAEAARTYNRTADLIGA